MRIILHKIYIYSKNGFTEYTVLNSDHPLHYTFKDHKIEVVDNSSFLKAELRDKGDKISFPKFFCK